MTFGFRGGRFNQAVIRVVIITIFLDVLSIRYTYANKFEKFHLSIALYKRGYNQIHVNILKRNGSKVIGSDSHSDTLHLF